MMRVIVIIVIVIVMIVIMMMIMMIMMIIHRANEQEALCLDSHITQDAAGSRQANIMQEIKVKEI